MQQLTQQLKSGYMELTEVPIPALNAGQILVRNHYSLISAGTEGKTVSDARKGYLAKARSRQKEVRMVINMIKQQGLMATYNIVMNKLEAPSALGYSTAGEVIAVADDVKDIQVGDRVACGGQGAHHADIVAVYRNLCVKLPPEVSYQQAAFTTVAAIAMQGIRQADVQAGGNCVVIGLGLIGQLTIQLLRAAGIKPIGIDIAAGPVAAVNQLEGAVAYTRDQEGLENIIIDSSGGFGTDAVIITAGTSSLDPVELAGVLCRPKGKVVIVGAVPTGFSRTNYYKKELDLRMSSSYGPGRYDATYEEKGVDYPIGHVRWTENRNMQTYVDLLAAGSLNADALISHVFPLVDAAKAYDLIMNRSEPFTGILLEYEEEIRITKRIDLSKKGIDPAKPAVGFIGAGNFAQNMLLPRLKGKVQLVGVATARGNSATYVGKKYNFSYCTTDVSELMKDEDINTVFITTRHHMHAEQVIAALQSKKNVFVEKPLAMTETELEAIAANFRAMEKPPCLMVGYNRRFAPFVQQVASLFPAERPKGIQIRVNAGQVPASHWVHDPKVGGGRIIGEGCHFVDLAIFLAASPVAHVSAFQLQTAEALQDSVVINLAFVNGSTASISYFSNGHKSVAKERMEVFCDGVIAQIDDFSRLLIQGNKAVKKKIAQDKGHQGELDAFVATIRDGNPSPISFEELYHSSLVTFKALKSIQRGQTIPIEHRF